ncbi:unnamed protein product, partial [Discosporangium mesarthrocarpum]
MQGGPSATQSNSRMQGVQGVNVTNFPMNGLPGMAGLPIAPPLPQPMQQMHSLGMMGASLPIYMANLPPMPPVQKPVCRHEKCSRLASFSFEGSREPVYCESHVPEVGGEPREKPCHTKGCSRRAVFGYNNANPIVGCSAHKLEGMIHMRAMHCEYPNCRTYPSFAPDGDPKRRFCKKHREPGMVYVNRKNCEALGCTRMAMWMHQHAGKKRFCTVHREDGMICAYRSILCAQEDCFKQPCYGDPALGKPTVCAEHRAPGMQEVRTRKCMAEGCNKVPSWGNDGKRLMCREHKQEGMVYTILTCEYPQCNKNPSFAPRGETRRRFCKRHSEPDMVNVYYKYCDTEGCHNRAVWSNSNQRACSTHRIPGMTGKTSTCQFAGTLCSRLASYAMPGDKARLCGEHKEPGMVQVRTRKCKHESCDKIPSFGYEGNSRDYCKLHSKEGMVYNAGSRERCRAEGCTMPGSFRGPGVGQMYCKDHKEEGMRGVQMKQCEEPRCTLPATFGMPSDKNAVFCSYHKRPEMQSCKKWQADGYTATEETTPANAPFKRKPSITSQNKRPRVTMYPNTSGQGVPAAPVPAAVAVAVSTTPAATTSSSTSIWGGEGETLPLPVPPTSSSPYRMTPHSSCTTPATSPASGYSMVPGFNSPLVGTLGGLSTSRGIRAILHPESVTALSPSTSQVAGS